MDHHDDEDTTDIQKQYLSIDVMTTVASKDAQDFMPDIVEEEEDEESNYEGKTFSEKLKHIYKKERLLIEVAIAMGLAYIFPEVGAVYLFPDVSAHWIAVIIIFFLSGISLNISELSSAATNYNFNSFVMIFNFLGISSVVNYVAHFFYVNEVVSEDLMKGMIICSCLSMPTNMMVVLSIASNGDEAQALFLATAMNLLGVFVTPLLIFLYLKEDSDINFVQTYKTISLRVLLPVFVGLCMRLKVNGAGAFVDERKRLFVDIRERCLVFVVYTTFCATFLDENDSTGSQILVMAISQEILLVSAMVISWILLFIFFNRQPKLRVVGMFGCSTKTAALGIPLISAIYEDSPKLGMYTLPLLIWYPSQLVIGSCISSRLKRFVNYKIKKHETERRQRIYHPKACGLVEQPSWLDSPPSNLEE